MFRSEVAPMLNNYKRLQKENERLQKKPSKKSVVSQDVKQTSDEKDDKEVSIEYDEFGRTPLSIASEKNDIETAKSIITRFPNLLHALNNDGSSALFVAVCKNNKKMVEFLLQNDAKVDQAVHGMRPIYMAAAKGYGAIVTLLLDRHADVNRFYNNIQSLLSAAISSGSTETVSILLEAKANVNAVDRDGMTPLGTTVHYQNHEMFKLLLKYKPKDNLSKKNYLHMATGSFLLTQSLLEAKVSQHTIADKSIHNQFYNVLKGHTPLTNAIVMNHAFLEYVEHIKSVQTIFESQPCATLETEGSYKKVIAALLENKPALNTENRTGYLPLQYAVEFGDLKLVKKLVKSKADINLPTSKCDAPLIIATRNDARDIVDYLLDKKADVQCRNKNGTDAFMLAVYSGSYTTLSPFFKYFDVNKIDSNGMTPLMVAIYQYVESSEYTLKLHYLNIIIQLLTNKASFIKKGRLDYSAISFVIQKNLDNLLPILLEYRKSDELNTYSNKDFCPLHEAVIANNETACQILLAEPSVNVDQRDGNGSSPLYYAIIKNQYPIVECLLKHGADTAVKCIKNKQYTINDLLQCDKNSKMREFIQMIKAKKPGLKGC